jgi:hypothetical protein
MASSVHFDETASAKKHSKDSQLHEKLYELSKECSEFSLRLAWIKLRWGGTYTNSVRDFVRNLDALVERKLVSLRSDENNVEMYSLRKHDNGDNRTGVLDHIHQIKSACSGQYKTQVEISEETKIREKTVRRYTPILLTVGVLIGQPGRPTRLTWNFEAEERLRNLTPWVQRINELRAQVAAIQTKV